MKENNVLLSPKELELMLQGSLLWSDVKPRVTSSKTGMRKLGETIPEKPSTPKLTEQIRVNQAKEKGVHSERLEGQAVIWLLSSVGLLTLSTWFYFVLFSK